MRAFPTLTKKTVGELSYSEPSIALDLDVIARSVVPIFEVTDADYAVKLNQDSFTMKFVASVVFTDKNLIQVEAALVKSVLSTETHEATCMVWDFLSIYQLAVLENSRSRETIIVESGA